jgi:hypothetical protein
MRPQHKPREGSKELLHSHFSSWTHLRRGDFEYMLLPIVINWISRRLFLWLRS